MTIRILENLPSVLTQLKFDQDAIDGSRRFIGTEQTAHHVWKDSDGQEYVTIDLCVEIPIQCCELKEAA